LQWISDEKLRKFAGLWIRKSKKMSLLKTASQATPPIVLSYGFLQIAITPWIGC
jgi:hypothetical protein